MKVRQQQQRQPCLNFSSLLQSSENAAELFMRGRQPPFTTGICLLDQQQQGFDNNNKGWRGNSGQPQAPDGEGLLRPGDVVEVYGGEGTCKSTFLLQMIVNAVLPKEWDGVLLAGEEAGVLMFDNRHKFNLLKLVTMLESRLTIILQQQNRPDLLEQPNLQQIIGSSLQRLHIVRCFNTLHFFATLRNLEPLLAAGGYSQPTRSSLQQQQQQQTQRQKHKERMGGSDSAAGTDGGSGSGDLNKSDQNRIRLLVVDSISAFHDLDKYTDKKQRQHGQVVNLLRHYVLTYNLILVATKAALYSKTRSSFGSAPTNNSAESYQHSPQQLQTHRPFCHHSSSISSSLPIPLHAEYMGNAWANLVKYRVTLRKEDSFSLKKTATSSQQSQEDEPTSDVEQRNHCRFKAWISLPKAAPSSPFSQSPSSNSFRVRSGLLCFDSA
ncbi:DNA repair protein xrcc2 [Balamuthia mandrillaris]